MKDKIMTILFITILFIFLCLNLFYEDNLISFEERRKLTTFPKININTIKDTSAMKNFEKYTLDQFAFRNKFRSLKTYFEFNVFKKLDCNNIVIDDEKIYKIEYPLNDKSVIDFSNKINKIYNDNLKGMNVYYSIIPDKNYYNNKKLFLKMDYDKLYYDTNNNINKNIEYIELRDILNKNDYYNTDTHWKQENIIKVVDKLSSSMKFYTDKSNMIIKSYNPFYGVYYGQLALNLKPDTIKYLTNNTIENAIVENIESSKTNKVYDINKLGKMDSYDIFLSGATPFITIINNNNLSNKELVIFRDSFASSIAPLLINSYSKITLIDLRYISSNIINKLIEFKDQDVLFLYSTLIVNNSLTLKD